MKYFFILVCLLPGMLFAQDGYIINGKVGRLNAPAKVYLRRYNPDLSSRTTDSAEIKDGVFSFKGKVKILAWSELTIEQGGSALQKGAEKDHLLFFLENTTITVTARDSVKNAVVKGSVIYEEERLLDSLLEPTEKKSRAYRDEYERKSPEERKDRPFVKKVEAQEAELDADRKLVYEKFITSHRDSYLALETFREHVIGYEVDLNTAEIEFNKFSEKVKNSSLGELVMKRIEEAKKTRIGTMAMDFTQNDTNGKPVKLSDFKGKYVLLDFWASWCGPCRRENPNVVAAYKKYKDRNFTVLSVSLDFPGKKDDWLAAVKADSLVWPQVSDLKGFFDNAAARLYGVHGIPSNFLLDPTGRIIAHNIMGDELEKELNKFLK